MSLALLALTGCVQVTVPPQPAPVPLKATAASRGPAAPEFTVTRSALNEATVAVPFDYDLLKFKGDEISVMELSARFGSNRSHMTILVAVPHTNAVKLIPMSTRRK
jgi:hypothetical protein